MNDRGFTLIEVLATFVVMGIIIGIAFPAIDNLYNDNKKYVYETYEKSLETAAKLYVDQYDRDLWSASPEQPVCIIIEYKDLKCENLIKDFSSRNKNEKLDEDNTKVYAIKKENNVAYNAILTTVSKDSPLHIYDTDTALFAQTLHKNGLDVPDCKDSELKGVCQ